MKQQGQNDMVNNDRVKRPITAGSRVKGQGARQLFFIAVGILLVSLCAVEVRAELTAKANHDHISIDFFYHGSTVSVSGIADRDADLIIKICSPEVQHSLRQKGKVAGVLWMNVGALTFEKVPHLYYLHSSKKVEELVSEEDLHTHLIGYSALEKRGEIKPISDQGQRAKWFHEFIKFKESSRLYAITSGQIVRQDEGGRQKYRAEFEWPYQAPPGTYTVTVYAVKGNRIIEKAESSVHVEQVGIVKALRGMSRNNGALYGILSVAVALIAGFGVGLIFRKGGGAH